MFNLNEDKSIYVTRGDVVAFAVSADCGTDKYVFKAADVVRFKVTEKKNCENVVLQKDFAAEDGADTVAILLTEQDTKIGDVISKPTDYWYEVELNPYTDPQTIIGYDEDGAKIFRLYPEGADVPPYEPTPEDIPVVDDELDVSSTRPVQNQAIARALNELEQAIKDAESEIDEGDRSLRESLNRLSDIVLSGEENAYKVGDIVKERLESHNADEEAHSAAITPAVNNRVDAHNTNERAHEGMFAPASHGHNYATVMRFEAHVDKSAWSADSDGRYSAIVPVAGVLQSDIPEVDVALTFNAEENKLIKKAWACVDRVFALDGEIKLWGEAKALPAGFDFRIKVVR